MPLKVNQPTTFTLSPNEQKSFILTMKEDDFAGIDWLANTSLTLTFKIEDANGKNWLEANSVDEDSVFFVAPKDGEYTLTVKFEKGSGVSDRQTVSLEYKNKFKLPVGAKLKEVRKINGYDVKILLSAETDAGNDSYVLIERAGRLKKILKAEAGAAGGGFSFPDNLANADTPTSKQAVSLIKATLDKTGDGVPDVMIDYFSGGSHCCFETFFINLGETVEVVEDIGTGHVGLEVSGKNPKGGLRFKTSDNGFAYWQTPFADSPFPDVILEFRNNKLRPNFELMKKPAPALAALKKKALAARQKLSLEPYKGEENEDSVLYEEAAPPGGVFWGEMLDLIYTGHEDLAWQFLDLVWYPQKQGKQLFIRDFKKRLAESQYWQMIEEDRNLNK